MLTPRFILFVIVAVFSPCIAIAAELDVLRPENWDRLAPRGDEAEAVLGDYVFRNDKIAVVVGNPELITGRSGHRSSFNLADACIIDMAAVSPDPKSPPGQDRLAFFRPGPRVNGHYSDFEGGTAHYLVDYAASFKPQQGKRVTLVLEDLVFRQGRPPVAVHYTLEDGWQHVLCETYYVNPTDRPPPRLPRGIMPRKLPATESEEIEELAAGPRAVGEDLIRMPDVMPQQEVASGIAVSPFGTRLQLDGTNSAERGYDVTRRLTWAFDPEAPLGWMSFGVTDEPSWTHIGADGKETVLSPKAERVDLKPGERLRVTKRVILGRDLFDVMAQADALRGIKTRTLTVQTRASDGEPGLDLLRVYSENPEEKDRLMGAGKPFWYGPQSEWAIALPDGEYIARPSSRGSPVAVRFSPATQPALMLTTPAMPTGLVTLSVKDRSGGVIPCVVEYRRIDHAATQPALRSKGSTSNPPRAVVLPSGIDTAQLSPGRYRVLASHGPEYSAFVREIDLKAGDHVKLEAVLDRVVDTDGWVSVDLHSVTTLSNNTVGGQPSWASVAGRMVSLAAQGIEFAPSTENNKVVDYAPWIKEAGLEKWIRTVTGITLTDGGRKYAFNDQYSFPIEYKPHWQDGGTPQRPQHCGQIEWLRSFGAPIDPLEPWKTAGKQGYEKLIVLMQDSNAPPKEPVVRPMTTSMYRDKDVPHYWNDQSAHVRPMFRDSDGDDEPDRVHHNFAVQMDALDVRTLAPLWDPSKHVDNDVLDWLRMRRAGYRMTGVIASRGIDNSIGRDGVGGVRSYVRCSTDDPTKIDPMEILRSVKAGAVVMSTGPFVEVAVRTDEGATGGIGDSVTTKTASAKLRVRVQAPEWITINRIRLWINGEWADKLERNRQRDDKLFRDAPVQFEEEIALPTPGDIQVIVCVLGHGPNLRAPDESSRGASNEIAQHAAITNPIRIDKDGDGFEPISPVEDAVESFLRPLAPLSSKDGAAPAKVRLTLINHGKIAAHGTARVLVTPSETVTLKSPVDLAYVIEPGGKAQFDLAMEMTRQAQTDVLLGDRPRPIIVRVPRHGRGAGLAPSMLTITPDQRPATMTEDEFPTTMQGAESRD